MSNAFSRSWEITKLSFHVIKQDKELLLFPLLAGIFSILFMAAMIFPAIATSFLQGAAQQPFGIFEYAIIFVTYLGIAFIATFFNVCVVYTTKVRFDGGNATFGESIKFALSKVHLIFAWSLVSATVGLILRILDRMAERAGQAGRMVLGILIAVLGMAWSIVAIFVVPGMVYYNLGPIEAIKSSVQTLRKTWGESLIRYFGLGLMEFLFIASGIVVAVMLFILLSGLGIFAIVAVLIMAILYLLGVILVFNVANSIFNTALYVYADTGKIPKGYSKEIMHDAFKSNKPKVSVGGIA